MKERQIRAVLLEAITNAVQAVGIDGFKRTSLFMSNERKATT